MAVVDKRYLVRKVVYNEDDEWDLLFSNFAKLTDPILIRRAKRVHPELSKIMREIRTDLIDVRKDYEKNVIKVAGKRFYLDKRMQRILEHFILGNRKKWDFIMLITGMEGAAKSTLAKALGFYLTKKYNCKNHFSNRNIVFTPSQFSEMVDILPEGSVIVWDEFVLGGMSTDMNAIQNTIIKKFTMIRKKRLFIILVIPFIWMLRTYFAIARTKLLVNVYSPDLIRRGYYKVWGLQKKKDLYFRGLQSSSKWSYNTVEPTLKCKFFQDIAQPNFFTNDVMYERKKDAAIVELTSKKVVGGEVDVEKEKKLKVKEEERLRREEERRLKDKERDSVFKTTKACPGCSARGSLRFFVGERAWSCLACGRNFESV